MRLTYLVPSDAKAGTVYGGRSALTSLTDDLNKYDNYITTEVTVDEVREEGPPPEEEP